MYVEGAKPGEALEVKVLSIDLAIDNAYNGCSGFIPANCDQTVPQKVVKLNRKTMTSEFRPGIAASAWRERRTARQPGTGRRQHIVYSGVRSWRAV